MNLRNSLGNTFLEITIALAITAVIGLILLQVSGDVYKSIRRGQLIMTRDQIVASVRERAGNYGDLKFSMSQPGNEPFFDCVCGTGGGCTSGRPLPFSLYDSTGTQEPIAEYYTADGVPCDKMAKNCLIEVVTRFSAQCLPTLPSADPSPPLTCSGVPAEIVGITYSVGRNLRSFDDGRSNILKTVTGTVWVQTADLTPAPLEDCIIK